MEEILKLLNQFEQKVQQAWTYDTKLWFEEDATKSKLEKSDTLFKESDDAKKAVIEAIKQGLCKC